MSAWEEVLTAAIVGTERRAAAPTAPGGMLGALVAALSDRPPEARLLATAGALALHRRAGRSPETDGRVLPPPAPPDDLPRCGSRVAARLARLLGGTYREVLPEWLAALAAAGRRVPEEVLPALLDLGGRDADAREALLPVLGTRGRWLAAQNPAWAWAAPDEDDEATWSLGERAARRALLRRLRRIEPARARELLASTWEQETPDDRAAFLGALAVGLSGEDEPFLEAALDDRRKEARQAAAALLARLPDSALVARMVARLDAVLRYEPSGRPGLFRRLTGQPGGRLVVAMPDDWRPEKAAERDGVEVKPPGRGTGERAWWLRQLLGRVPPSTWTRRWQVTPEVLLEMAAKTDWREALVEGWLDATVLHGDADWAAAIIEHDPRRAEVLTGLATEQRELLVLPLMRGKPEAGQSKGAGGLIDLLGRCDHIWSPALTRACLRHLPTWLARPAPMMGLGYPVQRLVPHLGRHGAPTLADEIVAAVPLIEEGDDYVRSRLISNLIDLVRFRQEMLKEIAE